MTEIANALVICNHGPLSPGGGRGINRIHHWCSVGTCKSQPVGQLFQWETRLHRVYHWNGGPEGWDFPVPLYTNDQFYFSHIS